MLRLQLLAIAMSAALLLGATPSRAQQLGFERLPADLLNASAPSERVSGEPGEMRITDRRCQSLPLETE